MPTSHDLFMDRLRKLFDEEWVPYTHAYHHEIMDYVTDTEFKKFVEERRRYYQPSFIGREPQWEFLDSLIEKYKIPVRKFSKEDF